MLQATALITRNHFYRIGIDDRLPDISQRLVNLRYKYVELRRLLVTRDHNRSSSVRLQIFGQNLQKFLLFRAESLRDRSATSAQHASQRRGKRNDVRSTHRQTIIGERSGSGREALNHVQTIHRSGGCELTATDEVVRVAHESGKV